MGKIEARKFIRYIKPTDTVLDFGCGGGNILANITAATRIGIEPNPAARAHCVQQSRGAIKAFAAVEEVPDQSVDVVITNHCLEHVPSPTAALRQLHRVLKPGGKLVAYVPIDDWRKQKRYDPADINHHLHTWSPLLFGHTLSESGFTDIDVGVFTHAYHPRYVPARLPVWLFDRACWCLAVILTRRQIRATARRR